MKRLRNILPLLVILGGMLILFYPTISNFLIMRNASRAVNNYDASADALSQEQYQKVLDAAHAYNEKLAQNDAGETDALASAVNSASTDEEYNSLLNIDGDGMMGYITVPKLEETLPIYHGTSEEALASGAGHLYGTSLPVGGKSTHSVITGHRGLVEALMFTRLDEVKEGDFFYIEVMGETLGYKVDRISVILPDDTSKLKIVPGEDRVTLMTCTPYGVNTHRLLISGHRVAIPMPAPEPNDVLDARNIALGVGLGILAAGLFIIWLARRHKAARIIRHGAFWPWMRRKGESANDTLA